MHAFVRLHLSAHSYVSDLLAPQVHRHRSQAFAIRTALSVLRDSRDRIGQIYYKIVRVYIELPKLSVQRYSNPLNFIKPKRYLAGRRPDSSQTLAQCTKNRAEPSSPPTTADVAVQRARTRWPGPANLRCTLPPITAWRCAMHTSLLVKTFPQSFATSSRGFNTKPRFCSRHHHDVFLCPARPYPVCRYYCFVHLAFQSQRDYLSASACASGLSLSSHSRLKTRHALFPTSLPCNKIVRPTRPTASTHT
jgi:hypothetical protein